MRALIQRSSKANLYVDNKIFSSINKGITLLLGIEPTDTIDDIEYLVKKISSLRIFDDENGVMNLSLADIKGDILIVSQFTLMARTKKGNRPSYIGAAQPNIAIPLYEKFIETTKQIADINVQTGVFGGDMKIELINDGPVTIWLDTNNK